MEAIGKTVLRPGGIKFTKKMLDTLEISVEDVVVEIAPGAEITTKIVIKENPKNYVAIERNEKFAQKIEKLLKNSPYSCVIGSAQNSQIEDDFATIIFGEAMLTMQTQTTKAAIMQEASRILKQNGLFAIHEVALRDEGLTDDLREQIFSDLRDALKVGAHPLTLKEWTNLLKENNFTIIDSFEDDMKVFSPKSFIGDEGLGRTLKILFNILRNKQVRGVSRRLERYLPNILII